MFMDQIQNVISYEPATGEFTWLVDTARNVKAGRLAGAVNTQGYRVITYKRKRYLAHRLAWFLTYGDFPAKDIDHVNRVKTDNRIKNLREATPSENAGNTNIKAANTSGYRGVRWVAKSKKWRAQIQHKHIGFFLTPEQASQAYEKAAKAVYGNFYSLDRRTSCAI